MSKKNLAIRIFIMIVLAAVMLPSFLVRVKNESANKDVIFALNYNNAVMVLNGEEVKNTLEENKKMGVNTVQIGEESINSLISAGEVTGIKYNVLRHKYDDETEEIIKLLGNNEKIHNDSYVLITKRDDKKAFLDKWINSKYTKDEFAKISTPLNADVYVLYENVNNVAKLAVGFDENKIAAAHSSGFDIVLSMMVSPYADTTYISYIDEIVKKYDVKYLNLKKGQENHSQEKYTEKNVSALCKVIEENGLYLILSEEQTQLSNQKPIGYAKLIESSKGRVLRGYDTADYETKNTGSTISDKRYYQILNSVVDRNIRFVNITQLTNGTDTFKEKSDKTNLATQKTIERLSAAGFNIAEYDTVYDYKTNRTLTSAAAMVIMIIMGLTVIEWLLGKKVKWLEILALAGSVLSIGFTYLAPEAIVLLYPTLFAVVAPCFTITATMLFAKNVRGKASNIAFVLSATALAAAVLGLCTYVQTSLLSGLDYYLNSIIFRGIKLSLLAPIAYAAVAYAIVFSDKEENFLTKVIRVLNADIKVYWMIIAGVIGGVGAIYLIRSGNVTSISPIESFMRNTITEIMTARPRTKEFLVGWPCFILFLYYLKNSRSVFLQWCFAVGSSILFASVINTFCHVFTSASVMYMRTVNGLFVGAAVSLGVMVLNAIIVKTVKYFIKKGNENG